MSRPCDIHLFGHRDRPTTPLGLLSKRHMASLLRSVNDLFDHVDHVSSGSAEFRPCRPWTTSTTSRAAPSSSDHINHGPRRPRPERLCRAPTTSITRPRRNDDRREERRYDDRDHSHDDRSKSSRTGQLHRQRHVKPSLEHRNTSTTPTGCQ